MILEHDRNVCCFFFIFYFFKSSLIDKPDCRKSLCQFHVGNDTERTKADGEKFVAQGPSLHMLIRRGGRNTKGSFYVKL